MSEGLLLAIQSPDWNRPFKRWAFYSDHLELGHPADPDLAAVPSP